MRRAGGARGTKASWWGREERVVPSATDTFWGEGSSFSPFSACRGPAWLPARPGGEGGCRVFSVGICGGPGGGPPLGGFSPPPLPFSDAPGLPPPTPHRLLRGRRGVCVSGGYAVGVSSCRGR